MTNVQDYNEFENEFEPALTSRQASQESGPDAGPAKLSTGHYLIEDEGLEDYLNKMEKLLKTARGVPLSDNCLVDREEMLFLTKMIREQLPEELRQARWLLQQNRQLILEARKEAESILRDAENKMARMIDEHEVTQLAQTEAQRILDQATAKSRQMHTQSLDYAKDMLDELDNQLTEMLVYIQKNKKALGQG